MNKKGIDLNIAAHPSIISWSIALFLIFVSDYMRIMAFSETRSLAGVMSVIFFILPFFWLFGNKIEYDDKKAAIL